MKTTQYVRQEKAIDSADRGGIRERWMWGLRLLRDPDAFARGGESDQLKPNTVEQLVGAATARGYKLSEREVQYRLKCARTYKTDNEITQVLAEFDSWWSLIQAGFPPYEVPEGEPPADHRSKSERDHDRARALAELIDGQGELFPLSDFEPVTTTLKELEEYTEEMEDLTARFALRDRKRRHYLERLKAAAGNDLSVTWKEAHDLLDDGTEPGIDEDPPLDPEDGIR